MADNKVEPTYMVTLNGYVIGLFTAADGVDVRPVGFGGEAGARLCLGDGRLELMAQLVDRPADDPHERPDAVQAIDVLVQRWSFDPDGPPHRDDMLRALQEALGWTGA